MGNKLYVGNLPYAVRDNDLQQQFGQFGNVVSAKVMMERDTGRSKGFGFVEMGSEAEAQAAINGLHGHDMGGRALVVNEARPMEPRPPRSGGGGFVKAAAVAMVAVMAVATVVATTVSAAPTAVVAVTVAAAVTAMAVAATKTTTTDCRSRLSSAC